ncbi:hypothetical protein Cob_v010385 [Colletotrichum orbiculare MAFF 240422]|uniref:Uncharacterized protein n=2 Tax=Colletotrichum orbiculare species complex TaxID=2707354 RepID=N4VQP2_COLOR|nr:hypothetical protein Cob_v010385 [Colletotrichum orbiculare MAFF 240422]TDZ32870.1 hypothetical protein C8035_v011639 [Colletotrichum spinosum]
MIPPKPQFVQEVERPRSSSISSSTRSFYQGFTTPTPPDNTYFATILRREREGTLPVYENEKQRPQTNSSARSFALSYRQELAHEARKRTRKYNFAAAVVVGLVLAGCAGTLAYVLVSSKWT